MSECIACKYSGSDERTYCSYGCPPCTCNELAKIDLRKPLKPEHLVGSLHDKIHTETTIKRKRSKTGKAK